MKQKKKKAARATGLTRHAVTVLLAGTASPGTLALARERFAQLRMEAHR